MGKHLKLNFLTIIIYSFVYTYTKIANENCELESQLKEKIMCQSN